VSQSEAALTFSLPTLFLLIAQDVTCLNGIPRARRSVQKKKRNPLRTSPKFCLLLGFRQVTTRADERRNFADNEQQFSSPVFGADRQCFGARQRSKAEEVT
jgi:hypothetical protein